MLNLRKASNMGNFLKQGVDVQFAETKLREPEEAPKQIHTHTIYIYIYMCVYSFFSNMA